MLTPLSASIILYLVSSIYVLQKSGWKCVIQSIMTTFLSRDGVDSSNGTSCFWPPHPMNFTLCIVEGHSHPMSRLERTISAWKLLQDWPVTDLQILGNMFLFWQPPWDCFTMNLDDILTWFPQSVLAMRQSHHWYDAVEVPLEIASVWHCEPSTRMMCLQFLR